MTEPTAEALIGAVEALAAAGVLNPGQARSLTGTLANASRLLADGKPVPASRQVEAFIREVEALVRGRVLSPAQAQPLLDGAHELLAAIAQA